MRRKPVHLLLLLAISGCAAPLAPAPGGGASSREALSQPPEPLGGLVFKVLAPENARYAGGVGGAAMPTGATTAPMPAPAATTAPGTSMPVPGGPSGPPAPPEGLNSGNMNGGYGYAYGYGPGFFGGEPTTLISLTQSETVGSKGPYRQLIEAVVQPVVKDWAADAKLMMSNATTGTDGLLTESPSSPPPSGFRAGCEPMYGSPSDSGWRLTYLSASRREMLNFYVMPAKTLVIRARWAPMDLAATPVAVDNDVALRSLATAIETRGFKGEEEKSGLDYFMGGSFGQGCFGPVAMPAPYPYGGSQENRTEVVYDVPDNARWNTSLQVILGKPVWELSFYAQPEPPKPTVAPGPQGEMPVYDDPGFYFNSSARGLVDATTGAVIRFSRPHRQFYAKPMKGPFPSPMPVAGEPPKMPPPSLAPTAGPSPSPSVDVSPSPSPSAAATPEQ